MILPLFRRDRHKRTIHGLYGAIVAQARSPVFYSRFGVPDTLQGRFDMLVLHLVLVLRRLGRGDGGARSLGRNVGQMLFDEFCRDLDGNLREMAVGDLTVPKEMRRFGEAFYGRQAAYEVALAAPDQRDLEKALARNIFEVVGNDDRAVRLAAYVRAGIKELDAMAEGALMGGAAPFPNPEAFAHAAA